ncbi:metal transporter CNNM4-like isoform X2 [Harpia harpyja]|uniref:metal transporter CNNM4-like isoform X2 n=1 Tax=Harpia harpyja TaxID=202280 RepID=UPI0022B0FABA|nr:metal transporter CNNM4-like isoform X2 [Harpia harpyja]
MEVEIGKESLKFENGAFTCYGVSALAPLPAGSGSLTAIHRVPIPGIQNRQLGCADYTSCSSYCPDYSVRVLTDLQLAKVMQLRLSRCPCGRRAPESSQVTQKHRAKNYPQQPARVPEPPEHHTSEQVRLDHGMAGQSGCQDARFGVPPARLPPPHTRHQSIPGGSGEPGPKPFCLPGAPGCSSGWEPVAAA